MLSILTIHVFHTFREYEIQIWVSCKTQFNALKTLINLNYS
jgi:hypothetical protein